jgi:hypothetical protein
MSRESSTNRFASSSRETGRPPPAFCSKEDWRPAKKLVRLSHPGDGSIPMACTFQPFNTACRRLLQAATVRIVPQCRSSRGFALFHGEPCVRKTSGASHSRTPILNVRSDSTDGLVWDTRRTASSATAVEDENQMSTRSCCIERRDEWVWLVA